MKSIRLAIAEDNTFAMKSVLQKLASSSDLLVRIQAFDGQELLDMLPSAGVIDIVLMDIQMPVMNGIEATRRVKSMNPRIKVIMLTTFDDDEKIFEAVTAGASGYLLKDEPEQKMVQAILDTMMGGGAMSPGIALKALNLIRNPPGTNLERQTFGLTKREIELLEQLKSGLSYEQVASNLYISLGTVQKHIANIYGKLQVNNKVEAVQKATKYRLV